MNSAVAAALRAELAVAGVSQNELARQTGIPQVSLQRYLADKRPITIEVLDAVAHALGMTILQVFEEAERRRMATPFDGPTPRTSPAPAQRTGSHPALPAPGDTRQVPSRQGHGHVPSRDRGAGRTRSHGNS